MGKFFLLMIECLHKNQNVMALRYHLVFPPNNRALHLTNTMI